MYRGWEKVGDGLGWSGMSKEGKEGRMGRFRRVSVDKTRFFLDLVSRFGEDECVRHASGRKSVVTNVSSAPKTTLVHAPFYHDTPGIKMPSQIP